MPAFVVVATRRPTTKLAARMAETLPSETVLKLNETAWLVAYEGTTRALSEVMGIRGGETDPGVVCKISNYSGRAASEVWEFLGEHLSEGSE